MNAWERIEMLMGGVEASKDELNDKLRRENKRNRFGDVYYFPPNVSISHIRQAAGPDWHELPRMLRAMIEKVELHHKLVDFRNKRDGRDIKYRGVPFMTVRDVRAAYEGDDDIVAEFWQRFNQMDALELLSGDDLEFRVL